MTEQQQPQRPPAEARAAAIAGALGAGAATTGGAEAGGSAILSAVTLTALTRLFLSWRYRRETVRYVLRVTTRILRVPPGPGAPSPAPGPASVATRRAARVFAAWFLERSSARVEQRYDRGMSREDAEAPEERYIEQHIDAQEAREKAAERVDQEAAKPGNVTDRPAGADGVPGDPDGMLEGTRPRVILRWRAHPDDKVTPECRAADGAWFYADTPPVIGFPGMPHGGTCRCWPAHAGSLAEVARGRHVNEAVRGIIATSDHRPHPVGREDEDDERQTA